MQLLCNDLRSADSPLYKNSIRKWDLPPFESLQNPWLRLIAYAITGNTERLGPSSMSVPRMPRSIGEVFADYLLSDRPLVELSILPRLRMRFLEEFDHDKMKDFMMEALVDVDKLKQLQIEFSQPSLGVDFGGDYLLQIFHSPFSIRNRRGLRNIEWEIKYGRIPGFLVNNNDGSSEFIKRHSTKFPRPYSDMRTSTDCISYLLELCRDIKRNPGRLTRLLIHMVSSDLEYINKFDNPICIMDFYDILKVVAECGLGKNGTSHSTDSYELAELVKKCRDKVTDCWEACRKHGNLGSLMEQMSGKEDFRVKCNEAIHDLISRPLTIFGLQTCRSLTCAQPTVAIDAAAGILRMYDI
ncbi:hypothetical protein CPB86DRAFT_786718 [Serendipita vermifera]|nr:hypothetical protein CPB86DRAFT_786718 [Serendipita vermifera]